MATMIEIDHVSLAFSRDGAETPVLQDFSLTLEQGTFAVIVGPSGVGKSTLLRVVAGLLPPTSGTARITNTPDPRRRGYGFVFQDARLLPWRRVLANVELGLEGLAIDRSDVRRRAEEALALVGLAGYGNRWPFELSGGQRQRVGIARALAVDPDVLLMDEPFGALDAITRTMLQDELVRIWEQNRKTVLFVTHDLDEATYLADRVLVLGGKPGRLTRDLRNPNPRQRTPRSPNGDTAWLEANMAENYQI
jgi:NitT/TauT family transport system ATP-binding protein